MKLRKIIEELEKLKQVAHFNKGNTFNHNDKKTKQDIEDYLNLNWTQTD